MVDVLLVELKVVLIRDPTSTDHSTVSAILADDPSVFLIPTDDPSVWATFIVSLFQFFQGPTIGTVVLISDSDP